MRIVIDLTEVLTGEASSSSVLSLSLAIAASRKHHDLVIVADSRCSETVDRIRALFKDVLPHDCIRFWDDPWKDHSDAWAASASRVLRKAFLNSFAADRIVVPGVISTDGDWLERELAILLPITSAETLGIKFWDLVQRSCIPAVIRRPAPRLRLAYISPLPPEHTGIADYSAALLPELTRWYDIDVVTDQEFIADTWVRENCRSISVDCFEETATQYDRIVYHIGNSPFHLRTFDLVAKAPGAVVLHDFHLGDIFFNWEFGRHESHVWIRELYRSAGYQAVSAGFRSRDFLSVIARYPCNFSVLSSATGVIVHSAFTRRRAVECYGHDFAANWRVIPLVRRPGRHQHDRITARVALGLADDDFLVCSFGMLGPLKLNLKLIEAWASSALINDPRCRLIFVGENDPDSFGKAVEQAIAAAGADDRIRITGWTDPDTYQLFLAAADVAVQLRTGGRGETSAAVMDCLTSGLPTIVNANGSAAELPADAVFMLPDEFSAAQLATLLEDLKGDPGGRAAVSRRGGEFAAKVLAPIHCANLYREAIEAFHAAAPGSVLKKRRLAAELADLPGAPQGTTDLRELTAAVNNALPGRQAARQILIDVSCLSRQDLQTGIQRVVRALTLALLNQPPQGWRIEPVSLSADGGPWHYQYARRWTSKILQIPADWADDEPVAFQSGDVLLIADFIGDMARHADQAGVFARLRAAGVGIHVIIYDLLPILLPEVFPPGQFGFTDWLDVVLRRADAVTCISKAVADDVTREAAIRRPAMQRPLKIGWFHLGDDPESSAPTTGRPDDADQTLAMIAARPSFLMVGTIEPRKGHLQTLAAFDLFWAGKGDANLVIVGREGWKGLPDDMRRTIPEIIDRLRSHPERGQRLFWIDDASDGYLEEIYGASTCLIAASDGEGFGLPLIEAARRGVPVLARDLPVFREIAGPHVSYFQAEGPAELAAAVEDWMQCRQAGTLPDIRDMPRRTWTHSAAQLLKNLPPHEHSHPSMTAPR
jgi:glycosyltransferase involved in cell wall biosynthesis